MALLGFQVYEVSEQQSIDVGDSTCLQAHCSRHARCISAAVASASVVSQCHVDVAAPKELGGHKFLHGVTCLSVFHIACQLFVEAIGSVRQSSTTCCTLSFCLFGATMTADAHPLKSSISIIGAIRCH